MIKRTTTWTLEEEWILFLLNRDKANKWADIANILEGRTDNSIKNHWNSSMKRRILIYQEQFEKLFKQRLQETPYKFMGCQPVETDENGHHILTEEERRKGYKNLPKNYITLLKKLETDLLDEKTAMVSEQTRSYYVEKCMEYIQKAEVDNYCLASAIIMLNSGSQYLKQLKSKYSWLLQKHHSAFSGDSKINMDTAQFDSIFN